MKNFFTILFLGLSMILSGCGSLGSLGSSFSTPVVLQEVNIHADDDSNDGDATEVDIVVVYDKALLDKLTNMKSKDYFAKAEEIEENNPETMERFHFEVVAGSTITEELNLKSNRGVGALIFADIDAPGTHRHRVGPATGATIKILQSSMEVEEKQSFKVSTVLKKSTSWLF